MKIHNCEQRTDEWFAVRNLKMTASNASAISACGKGLETYAKELVAEFLGGHKEIYVNGDMQRGIELEDEARAFAEQLTGLKFDQVGFIEMNNRVGASPDGVIFDKNGKIEKLIEIKNHNDKVFLDLILTNEIDKKYIAQMQMQMLVCECDECLYFGYNQNVKPYYFMRWIKADKKIQEKLISGFEKCQQLIDEYLLKAFEYENKN